MSQSFNDQVTSFIRFV